MYMSLKHGTFIFFFSSAGLDAESGHHPETKERKGKVEQPDMGFEPATSSSRVK